MSEKEDVAANYAIVVNATNVAYPLFLQLLQKLQVCIRDYDLRILLARAFHGR